MRWLSTVPLLVPLLVRCRLARARTPRRTRRPAVPLATSPTLGTSLTSTAVLVLAPSAWGDPTCSPVATTRVVRAPGWTQPGWTDAGAGDAVGTGEREEEDAATLRVLLLSDGVPTLASANRLPRSARRSTLSPSKLTFANMRTSPSSGASTAIHLSCTKKLTRVAAPPLARPVLMVIRLLSHARVLPILLTFLVGRDCAPLSKECSSPSKTWTPIAGPAHVATPMKMLSPS